ncbi:MAG: LacI family DNA-binding transcriptional regulator [Pseudomonadota bacterium]
MEDAGPNISLKPTVNDIAREAGVSLATVDRVLNNRPGVRAVTVERVQSAIQTLGYVRDLSAANLARQRQYRFVFVLPDGQGQFLSGLRNSIYEAAASSQFDRTDVKMLLIPNRDHTSLVQMLADLDPQNIDGVAIMANETPVVRDAIARLKSQGVAVVSLVSDQPNSERDHFVGFDNVAAGRTAGMLLGRFVGQKSGKVVVVVTSMQARDMIERRLGFDQVMADHFPNLEPLPSVEGHDDEALTERLTRMALAQSQDVVGVYSVGASVRGVTAAFDALTGDERPVCIDHELTDNSYELLQRGTIDAVITQNIGHLARSALRVLRARCDNAPVIASQENIRIDILIRENLPENRPVRDPQ